MINPQHVTVKAAETKMNDQIRKKPSALGELALWFLSTLFVTALALLAVGSAKVLLGWSDSQWLVSSVAVGLFSATWGSWASMIWTQSRVLRTLMITVALIPGILMVLVGGWAFLHVPDNIWVWRWGWLILAGHGVGALAMTSILGGRSLIAGKVSSTLRSRRLAMGWTIYPVAVVVTSVALLALSFAVMPAMGMEAANYPVLEKLARWVIPSQALVLLTTAVPALSAHICIRLSGRENLQD